MHALPPSPMPILLLLLPLLPTPTPPSAHARVVVGVVVVCLPTPKNPPESRNEPYWTTLLLLLVLVLHFPPPEFAFAVMDRVIVDWGSVTTGMVISSRWSIPPPREERNGA